jgi:hypothetical protein
VSKLRQVAASLALGAGLLVSSAAAAETCQQQIDEELQRMSVPSENVESIDIMRRSFGAKASNNFSYDAWIRLKSCDSGHLVVHLSKSCAVMSSYTTGNCKMPDMTSY